MKAGASTKLAMLYYNTTGYFNLQQLGGGLGGSQMEFTTQLKRMRYGPFVTGTYLMGIVRLHMSTSVPS